MDEMDAALARRLADAAGAVLLDLRRTNHDPDAVRAEGDRRAQEVIDRQLRAHRPADAVLSEEAPDDPARLAADRVWIVDPLDGTREFGEPGRTDWAVHVALWQAGELTAGAVALPALGRTYATDEPIPSPPARAGRLRIAVSRTRPPAEARQLVSTLDAELVPMGSAGAKVMAVVSGEVDVYLHSGGQYEWDSAAPVAVARAAGLHTSRLDGTALTYNKADLRVPDLLVCRPELAGAVLAEVPA
ncbi:3'(2'),5'-bisphosphate nucleotidase CysQ [Amycolatopsis sp. NPDC059027]|uniref:3'(2'),5'-bisphosphate nucleotidase CysQ n=1 Tax=Amycolatopsis sp. NPDC059027 TaxID=3346709 RepID=UPI0036722269